MSPTRPVSDAFLRAIRGSHTMVARARICTAGQTGVNPTGTEIGIIDGDVQLDAAAEVRSTLDMTTPGQGMWPSRANLLLAPYGNEVFVERGVKLGGGGIEWVSLGYHRLYSVDQDNAPDGPIRIGARDRMAGIVDAKLTEPRQYTASQTVGTVVDDLVLEVYPWASIEWDDATDLSTVGRDVIGEQDRYGLLHDVVTSVGKVCYWDYRGVLVVRAPPDPSSPVFEINHGTDGVLVEMSRLLTRDGVYNAVVATGEAADAENPVRAVVVDTNPNSPTWWSGSFGQAPRFYSSPFLTTFEQAASAAAALLRRANGLPYSVDFTSVPNPALEPDDPVRIVTRAGSEIHVIETLTVPLIANAASGARTREQPKAV